MSVFLGTERLAGASVTFPLFTPMWQDHQVDDISWLRADTFSWQSGSVYTLAYNHLVSDMATATSSGGEYRSSNITTIGTLTNNNGVINGFNNQLAYANFPAKTATSSFELVIKTKQTSLVNNSSILESSVAYHGIILRCTNTSTGQLTMWYGVNGSWALSSVNTNIYIVADTWIYIKIAWDGTTLTLSTSSDGETYTQAYTATVGACTWSNANGVQNFSSCTWENYPNTNGIVDLNKCYLNIDGNRFWTGCNYWPTYYQASDGHKIVTAEAETEMLNLYNTTGVAWYYILDTTNTRFKLPRTKWGFKGLRDGVGEYIEPGLPNITGTFPNGNEKNNFNPTGAFYKTSNTNSTAYSGTANPNTIGFDASRSSSIYGNSTTVQESATQMYLYMYIGQFTQSATQQTAGLNSSLFNAKADTNLLNIANNVDIVIESYQNGTEWYRIYKSGWVEQGGYYYGTVDNWTNINFYKNYNELPIVTISRLGPTGDDSSTADRRHVMIRNITTSGFNAWGVWANYKFLWYSCGQGANL